MYAGGNAGTHQTYRANRKAFEKYGIIPRMLVDAGIRDLRVSKIPIPVKIPWRDTLPRSTSVERLTPHHF